MNVASVVRPCFVALVASSVPLLPRLQSAAIAQTASPSGAVSLAASQPEPASAANEERSRAARSIRLADLAVYMASVKTGEALVFTYDITNVGDAAVSIPHQDFGNLIAISYAWEPLSESAKQTKSSVSRDGNRVAAGGEFTLQAISSAPDRSFAPGEKERKVGRVRPFEPLLPGEYRLHVTLFSRSSANSEPTQTMSADFTIVP